MILRTFNINDASTILSWCKDKKEYEMVLQLEKI